MVYRKRNQITIHVFPSSRGVDEEVSIVATAVVKSLMEQSKVLSPMRRLTTITIGVRRPLCRSIKHKMNS